MTSPQHQRTISGQSFPHHQPQQQQQQHLQLPQQPQHLQQPQQHQMPGRRSPQPGATPSEQALYRVNPAFVEDLTVQIGHSAHNRSAEDLLLDPHGGSLAYVDSPLLGAAHHGHHPHHQPQRFPRHQRGFTGDSFSESPAATALPSTLLQTNAAQLKLPPQQQHSGEPGATLQELQLHVVERYIVTVCAFNPTAASALVAMDKDTQEELWRRADLDHVFPDDFWRQARALNPFLECPLTPDNDRLLALCTEMECVVKLQSSVHQLVPAARQRMPTGRALRDVALSRLKKRGFAEWMPVWMKAHAQ